jgi:ferredoxin--NADP+ reductase
LLPPTGESDLIEAQLVFRSIGYRATPVPGLPFDNRRGTLPNDGGRVINPDTGRLIPGVYAAGWIKRGPSGVIGTNKKCANETVALLLEDDASASCQRQRLTGARCLTRLPDEEWALSTTTHGGGLTNSSARRAKRRDVRESS